MHEINGYTENDDGSKYLTLISVDKNNEEIKFMKKYAIKRILSSQKIITQTIMMINAWTRNSILVIICH